MERALLKRWVDYAKEQEAVILFDGAYEAYVQSPSVPRSIYEIEGAKEVAIEVRSFSKSAGFTGLRCSYTVIPHQLKICDAGEMQSLHSLWKRRHDTKCNGIAYPVQKAAAALYTPEGQKEMKESIDSFMQSTHILRSGLQKLGFTVYGGIDAPYIWCKTPGQMKSWEFFDHLLEKRDIVTVPGSGFGPSGEGFVRFSSFADPAHITTALSRLQSL
jgi:LL-diaminopimelate aminotransferase